MISRRRFLSIAAAAVGTPAFGAPLRWRDVALGAEASLTIHAPPAQAEHALREVRALLRRVETLFSLFDPASDLAMLNQRGLLANPAPEFAQLLSLADRVHRATGGIFDPTIQPLWLAVSRQEPVAQAQGLIGWARTRRTPHRVALEPGQALTLNGIAQGYATDLVADAASTAFCMMPVPAIRNALSKLPGAPDATLVDTRGQVVSLS
ncbi:FAD:protein FMN transferase [Sedimentitalea todarodis]|uniref:FAD:protein FMN transferase n=1 Tax=Sedimentitalea todarodis TaxID=1631240 RepID=A0ABU3VBJ9_9RHOB|nr:FAD:protein FMN transferase [Sedimentitalea todarodis]MDU9003551.1 FAD:protein FMN transferase [Sedimentitalea todarodis]